MRALNTRNDKELASNVVVAERILDRMKGLIGKEGLYEGEALLIRPCKSIHTIGMRFPIDVLFLDFDNRVVESREEMPPFRLTRTYLKASTVLELPAGTLSLTETRKGDTISFGTLFYIVKPAISPPFLRFSPPCQAPLRHSSPLSSPFRR
jgi:uncharacterized membrane protein (UPF0127 family)